MVRPTTVDDADSAKEDCNIPKAVASSDTHGTDLTPVPSDSVNNTDTQVVEAQTEDQAKENIMDVDENG